MSSDQKAKKAAHIIGKSGIIRGKSSEKETIHAVETPLLICSKVVSSIGKVMASDFFGCKKHCFYYVQKGHTINREYYANLLRHL